jgi:MFS transporter, MFS domain-containing protein family, molybdate-anion transporter
MYLFIFFWTAALKSAQGESDVAEGLPFGLIFSCYMCMMMLGSRLFSGILQRVDSTAAPYMLLVLTAVASGSLSSSILFTDEKHIFWAFCLFEGCIGVYFPTMAVLKGKVVEDRVRGKIYGMLRMPLNLFVVVTHSLAEEGTTRSSLRCQSNADVSQVIDTEITCS